MPKKTGLGRGLSALVSEASEETGIQDPKHAVLELEISKIHRNESQPRTFFDEEELEQLTQSVREVGVLQPILVRTDGDEYEIIAGERRFQAACRAGLETIPVCIKDIDDNTSLEYALIENIQRSNLNGIEEARAYRDLLDRVGSTQEELSKRLGKSRSAIANALRLLDLPAEIQDMVVNGQITPGHARAILSVVGDDQRIALAQRVVQNRLSVRQTEELATTMSQKKERVQRPAMPGVYKQVARRLKKEFDAPVKIKQARDAFKLEITFKDEAELTRLLELMHIE